MHTDQSLPKVAPVITINDLCTQLNISQSTARRLANKGELNLRKLGGRVVVTADDLNAFLGSLPLAKFRY